MCAVPSLVNLSRLRKGLVHVMFLLKKKTLTSIFLISERYGYPPPPPQHYPPHDGYYRGDHYRGHVDGYRGRGGRGYYRGRGRGGYPPQDYRPHYHEREGYPPPGVNLIRLFLPRHWRDNQARV
jgi:hypothetical protein